MFEPNELSENRDNLNIQGIAFFINNVSMSQHYCFLIGVIYLSLLSGARESFF